MYDLTKISVKMSWQLYFKIKIRPLQKNSKINTKMFLHT